MFGIQNYEQRSNEVKQFDEALANSSKDVQWKSIELVDKFLIEKLNLIALTKDHFHQMNELKRNMDAPDDDDNDNLLDQRHHIDAISEKFMLNIDSIWYALMELETTLHERINESMIIFNDTIRGIIENLIARSDEQFDCIRSACVEYFQLKNLNDFGSAMATKTSSSSSSSSLPSSPSSTIDMVRPTEAHHMNIINQRMDSLCCRAKKWLSEVMAKYEQ